MSPNITIKADKNLIIGCTTFENSAYPENWPLLYKALSMLATKKNERSQGNCTSLSILNKKFLNTFNCVPKTNKSLSKILQKRRVADY